MSTNLEYRERERQRKGESWGQTSEAQREKERQRARARDKKQGDIFWKFCGSGEQMRWGKKQRQWKKKWTKEHVRHFLHKKCNEEVSGRFHFVVVQNNGKEMCKKSVLHVQSCFC